MTPLEQLLEHLAETAKSHSEKGNYFERLVKIYLCNEPRYKTLFEQQVYLWEDWRELQIKDGQPDPGTDTGIDLVAVEAVKKDPRTFAIQAKHYAKGSTIHKEDIDSYLSATGKSPYTNGLLFVTNDKISPQATRMLEGRDKPVNLINLETLEESIVDWTSYQEGKKPVLAEKKTPRPHQDDAIHDVLSGFKEKDRGKLIMACGTGKTFASLKIAEAQAGAGGNVLFLVPSLALLSQSLGEWTQESSLPLASFAVCSDSKVGKKKSKNNELRIISHELQYPATTNAARLGAEVTNKHNKNQMTVVFATYHSIDVISEAQKQHGLKPFDLIICDEAHRTTGATWAGEDESHFVKVHKDANIQAKKRLYMTATPKVYGEAAKDRQKDGDVTLVSMDDKSQYGEAFHTLTFSKAVYKELLCDYKVIVLTVDEGYISYRLQNLLKDENNSLRADDAARIIGSFKALAKTGLDLSGVEDHNPMRRAVAFCQVIDPATGRTHKTSSKHIASLFQDVVEAYQKEVAKDPDFKEPTTDLICEAEHVDGRMNALEKEAQISWLKSDVPDDTCRILSNVRCLSEGVDVPALDAVLFLSPKSSVSEVVQSVGRVMRKAPNKQKGYVILPVVIPAGVSPEEALADNKTFKTVWEVLQALRSHDDRFNASVNAVGINERLDKDRIEVTHITGKEGLNKPHKTSKKRRGGKMIANEPQPQQPQGEIDFTPSDFERALVPKLVEKCGDRLYWEDWANDIAKIATTHIARIKGILEQKSNAKEIKAFNAFAKELRDDLNDEITNEEIIEMLAQHLITKPVFDALFEDQRFTKHNPVSMAMQKVLDILHTHHIDKEAQTLERFYESVKERAEGIRTMHGRQKIIIELYDKFFSKAFKRLTERLGIVYTPVEVVDFIIYSINDILGKEFGSTLGSKNVHIIDPFTGTGTFITRLLQSGLIKPQELEHKYQNEIHANEIVLLAYYIAAINIEAVYHGLQNRGDYQPFEGICLTDTFQMHEKEDLISDLMVDNSNRRKRQKRLDIRVIMANPPYSARQRSQNDDNANIQYPRLDQCIKETYVKRTEAANKNALYDSYVRAIRWASDRIGNSGVIGFVTNAGWLDKATMDGMRKCLAEEFSSIYIFHLRGDQRTQGEISRREGGKIFGGGSRTPIAISLLVKNPNAAEFGKIYFHDIGDYLDRKKKLKIIRDFGSIDGIAKEKGWSEITPNRHGDWLNQRDEDFHTFLQLGSKKSTREALLFDLHSSGIKTNRDAWCYNPSKDQLIHNITQTINCYNDNLSKWEKAKMRGEKVPRFERDKRQISWSGNLEKELKCCKPMTTEDGVAIQSIYRPFAKSWLYYGRRLNERVYRMPAIFPEPGLNNYVIAVSGKGRKGDFSCLMTDALPDVQMMQNGQCFPRWRYEPIDKDSSKEDLLSAVQKSEIVTAKSGKRYHRASAMSEEGMAEIRDAYPSHDITKDDVFYYLYGILHCEDYRTRFAASLVKELPRLPLVKTAKGFTAYCNAGKKLADLHTNYENVSMYDAYIDTGDRRLKDLKDKDYHVTKMKHAKKINEEGKKVDDLTTILYNDHITIKDIPEKAYDYIVNGKSAIKWVMERQCVKTDKASGIVSDANLYASETMNNPRYPLDLLLRIITVSLSTQEIVKSLPPLNLAG